MGTCNTMGQNPISYYTYEWRCEKAQKIFVDTENHEKTNLSRNFYWKKTSKIISNVIFFKCKIRKMMTLLFFTFHLKCGFIIFHIMAIDLEQTILSLKVNNQFFIKSEKVTISLKFFLTEKIFAIWNRKYLIWNLYWRKSMGAAEKVVK